MSEKLIPQWFPLRHKWYQNMLKIKGAVFPILWRLVILLCDRYRLENKSVFKVDLWLKCEYKVV